MSPPSGIDSTLYHGATSRSLKVWRYPLLTTNMGIFTVYGVRRSSVEERPIMVRQVIGSTPLVLSIELFLVPNSAP